MGILPTPEPQEQKSANHAKRKSKQFDFGSLAPLQAKGTVGFSGYREAVKEKSPKAAKKNGEDMDSDEDDMKPRNNGVKNDDVADDRKIELTPEELKKQTELAEGVKKIQVSFRCYL